MDIFMDATLLSRIQFAATAAYHFFFVPLSVGIGLILVIAETRYYRSRKPEDAAASKFWVKIFTLAFAVGVATGITMEFSFGTNWADYARFVGDIFGAPLAAEALLAFFLESVFLGILIFGRKKVSPKFYLVSAWLVWLGSCLSALWILIANSWQQTPAGAVLADDGSRAIITDFFAAAFNPSTLSRYSHTVVALLIMGAFFAMAVAAWYLHKKKHTDFAVKTLRGSSVVAIILSCLMLVTAHSSAVTVAEEQPTKLAMMEGQYESEAAPMYLLGWVDEESGEVLAPFSIPGATSFLASGSFDTVYPGLNDLAETEEYKDIKVDEMPVQIVFQSYHLMVFMYGLIMLCSILALIFSFRGTKVKDWGWLQWLLIISPVFPFLAIQTGWLTAEMGRQPWVVYPSTTGPEGISLLTADGASKSLTGIEVIITLVLFTLVYLVIMIAWIRITAMLVKRGPVEKNAKEDNLEVAGGTRTGAIPAVISAVSSSQSISIEEPPNDRKGGE